jgi:hypothetical protein
VFTTDGLNALEDRIEASFLGYALQILHIVSTGIFVPDLTCYWV